MEPGTTIIIEDDGDKSSKVKFTAADYGNIVAKYCADHNFKPLNYDDTKGEVTLIGGENS